MQHIHVLKKLNFDLMTSSPGWGGLGGGCRVSAGKHIATLLLYFVIPFNWICNISMF